MPALLPVNQLNALPLVTAVDFTDGLGGAGKLFTGQMLKTWDPAATGISGVPSLSNSKWGLVGKWLDLGSCRHFYGIVVRTVAAAHATLGMTIQVQYRLSPTDAPPNTFFDGGSLQDGYVACYNLHTTAIIWPNTAIGTSIRAVKAWGPAQASAASIEQTSVVIGSNVRFQLSWGTNDPTNVGADLSTYALYLAGVS